MSGNGRVLLLAKQSKAAVKLKIDMENSMVSVIMPAYESPRYVAAAIESVISQSYENWELIVIDDCSSDNTAEVIQSYADSDCRVRLIKNAKNCGPAVSRNAGIRQSSGRYIAFLDCDDIWLPDKLKTQVEFMRKNGYFFTCTDYAQMNSNGVLTGRVIGCKERCGYDGCVWTNPIGNSTVMYDTEHFGKVYYPEVVNREDYAMWLSILKKREYIYGIKQTLTHYRLSGNSFSGNKLKMAKYQYRVYRECEGFCPLRAAFHVLMWGVIKLLGIK